jgi:hypothetical protein
MGYRIDFAVGGNTLLARIRGGSSTQAARIARDIAEEARRSAAKQLLIDVRGLRDRLGSLGTLALAASREQRVAVVDSGENALFHPFSEFAARRRGHQLRYFSDAAAALAWLHEAGN